MNPKVVILFAFDFLVLTFALVTYHNVALRQMKKASQFPERLLK